MKWVSKVSLVASSDKLRSLLQRCSKQHFDTFTQSTYERVQNMKIEKLRKEAVRSVRQINDVVHLSGQELRQVVGGRSAASFDQIIDEDTCAIHFYYPADSVD